MVNDFAEDAYERPEPQGFDTISTYSEGSLHPVLASLCSIIPALAESLGHDSEVALHDLSKLPNSIIAIGGNVTGRKPGDPMTDLLAKLIRQGQSEHVKNYRTVMPDRRVLRSSTLFIKDEHDVPIGCLCVNTDISGWVQAKDLLMGRIDPQATMNEGFANRPSPSIDDFQSTYRNPSIGHDTEVSEFFVSNVEDLQKTMVEKAIAGVGIPLHLMTKGHKIKVVQRLEESGFFLIRDSAEYLAQAIGVTRYTIYNYLNQLRVSNKFSDGEDELSES